MGLFNTFRHNVGGLDDMIALPLDADLHVRLAIRLSQLESSQVKSLLKSDFLTHLLVQELWIYLESA